MIDENIRNPGLGFKPKLMKILGIKLVHSQLVKRHSPETETEIFWENLSFGLICGENRTLHPDSYFLEML